LLLVLLLLVVLPLLLFRLGALPCLPLPTLRPAVRQAPRLSSAAHSASSSTSSSTTTARRHGLQQQPIKRRPKHARLRVEGDRSHHL
jgi:hypothetical protein